MAARVAALFISFVSVVHGQDITWFPKWLRAGSGSGAIKVTISNVSPETYQLLAAGNVGIRWHDHIIPAQFNLNTLDFDVPPELRVPDYTEFVFWDLESQRPLPYGGWIPVLIPISSTSIFEVDSSRDRVAVAAGLTRDGPGGQILVYHLSTGKLAQTIDIPSSQRVLAFTPDTEFAWILQDEAQRILGRLNLTSGAVDQTIQAASSLPSASLSAQVYRADPRILILSNNANGGEIATAYLNGSPLLGKTPSTIKLPLSTDDRSRPLLPGGRVCDLTPAAGFTNCTLLIPGLTVDFLGAWKNTAVTSTIAFDRSTGTVLQFFASHLGAASFLPESNRVALALEGIVFTDAETRETYASISGLGTLIRTWAPDYLLSLVLVDDPTREVSQGLLVARMPQLAEAPEVTLAGVAHGATLATGPVAPGEVITLFGKNLGPISGSGPIIQGKLQLATEVDHTKVLFDGAAGAILYAGPSQINVVVPETVQSGRPVDVQVSRSQIPSQRLHLQTDAARPGLFGYDLQGRIYAAALNPDQKLQGPNAPLRRGQPVTLYATGLGLPPGIPANAIAARATPLQSRPVLMIGGRPAQVSYAGLSPGLSVGVTQLNVVVPVDAPAGTAIEVVIGANDITQGNVWVSVE